MKCKKIDNIPVYTFFFLKRFTVILKISKKFICLQVIKHINKTQI